MITYLMSRGFRPSLVKPSTISGSIAQLKFVSIRMIPSLVLSAHEECCRVPNQYKLSKALYGDAYHPALSGVAGAAAAPRGAAPPAPAGAAPGRQRLTNVPRKSSPAAAFATAICESISVGV